MKLPARTLPKKRLVFPKKNIWGANLKVVLREKAKLLPEYRIPVELEPSVSGMTDTGVPIPIDILGRWVFGVPGYQGNCVFEGGVEDSIQIRIPDGIPEVENLLTKAVSQL